MRDLQAMLNAIGWSRPTLARKLGCSPSIVQRWAEGERRAPPEVLVWLEPLAQVATRSPPAWRQNSGYGL